eukprot:GHVU01024409.1.p1 GENE.GHVU01024409.1~~GHVU01024409.1.p1  ORF type:complete len:163 (+),score=11.78 GHVU01024409.1:1033-1521(+)
MEMRRPRLWTCNCVRASFIFVAPLFYGIFFVFLATFDMRNTMFTSICLTLAGFCVFTFILAQSGLLSKNVSALRASEMLLVRRQTRAPHPAATIDALHPSIHSFIHPIHPFIHSPIHPSSGRICGYTSVDPFVHPPTHHALIAFVDPSFLLSAADRSWMTNE